MHVPGVDKITLDGAGSGCPTANDDAGYMIMVSPNTSKIYVTGSTYETSVSLNATTVCYSDNGSTVSEDYRHTFDRNSTDNGPRGSATKYPLELSYDGCHGWDFIYVTGYSLESSSGPWDATTLEYGLTGNCTEGPGTGDRTMGSANSQVIFEPVVYPNPFSGKAMFALGISDTPLENAVYIIYDLTGKEAKRIENITASEFEIDMSGFDDGLYFYKFVQVENIIASGKFIIRN